VFTCQVRLILICFSADEILFALGTHGRCIVAYLRTIDTTRTTVDEAANVVLRHLEDEGYLR